MDESRPREQVEAVAERCAARVVPRLSHLRRSVVHNDANDHNVVVDSGAVAGIIDFGDMVHSITAAEAAVGAAYALLEEPDPLAAASHVARGFDRVFPLLPDEKSVLFDLMLLRLALSVSICAEQKRLQPRNPYLLVSERPARSALEQLTPIDSTAATQRLFDGAASS